MRKGWELSTIGEVCRIVNGGTPKTQVAKFWDGAHAWITPAEMGGKDSPYVASTQRTLSDEGLARCSASLLPPYSVILSSRAPIGHLVINEVPMATNQGCKGLVTDDRLDHKFLYYHLLASKGLLQSLGFGATFPELSASRLRTVPIHLPPLTDQKRIVAILDTVFEEIDTAIANSQQNRAHARALFQSYFATVFMRRRGEWPEVSLADICENLDRRRVPITKRDRKAGEVPYYGASGVVDHVEGYLFDEDLLLISEDGANLLARTYPIAFSISGKAWVNNHAHVLRFKELGAQKFVEHYLNSISLTPYVSGMAQPKLNQKALNSIPVPFPPTIEERAAVVEQIESVFENTQSLQDQYDRKESLLDALRQSVLSKAFEGTLTAEPKVALRGATVQAVA